MQDEARRRRTAGDATVNAAVEEPGSRNSNGDAASSGFKFLDVLRILGGLVLLSSALSYFVTQESLTWGWRPWFSQPRVVLSWLKGPVRLTDAELKNYDGSVAGRPIYVGLNGTIYDVTEGRNTYGPGGAYHQLAGKDGARAYVTGCLPDDLTPDLRGVEEMFIPLDDTSAPELTRAERKIQREQDLRAARKQVKATLDGWKVLFSGKGKKPYFEAGVIVRQEGWLEQMPTLTLCKAAADKRPKRAAAGRAAHKKYH